MSKRIENNRAVARSQANAIAVSSRQSSPYNSIFTDYFVRNDTRMDTPLDIQARRDEGRFVMRWADDKETAYTFYDLRCECQCAACVDEHTGRKILDPATVPRDITVQNAKLVGNYAIKIGWSDGHDTGLYTWDFIRSLSAKA